MSRNSRKLLRFPLYLGVCFTLAACGARDAADTRRAGTRVELAKDFLRRGELDAAEVEGKRALALDAESAEAEYVLGLVGSMRAATTLRVLEIDDCLTGIDAEQLRGEFDAHLAAAEVHLKRAVELDPAFAEAWAVRGVIADQLGDPATAIKHLERALAEPYRLLDVGVTRANLGLAYLHHDDPLHAAKELRQAIQFNPSMCLARYRLGRVYFARKEWNKAAEQFQTVVADKSCPVQEAHLFLLKSNRELGAAEAAEAARASCVALAAKSCVAAQCRAVP